MFEHPKCNKNVKSSDILQIYFTDTKKKKEYAKIIIFFISRFFFCTFVSFPPHPNQNMYILTKLPFQYQTIQDFLSRISFLTVEPNRNMFIY